MKVFASVRLIIFGQKKKVDNRLSTDVYFPCNPFLSPKGGILGIFLFVSWAVCGFVSAMVACNLSPISSFAT